MSLGFISHREAMIRHALTRLYDRAGITLTDAGYEAVAAGIKAGIYPVCAIDQYKQKVYRIDLHGRAVFAVWSHEHDCVRTFVTNWIRRAA